MPSGTLDQIWSYGHRISNHTYTHADLGLLSDTQVQNEVLNTHAVVAPFVSNKSYFLTPPGNSWSQNIANYVNAAINYLIGPITPNYFPNYSGQAAQHCDSGDDGSWVTQLNGGDWDCADEQHYVEPTVYANAVLAQLDALEQQGQPWSGCFFNHDRNVNTTDWDGINRPQERRNYAYQVAQVLIPGL